MIKNDKRRKRLDSVHRHNILSSLSDFRNFSMESIYFDSEKS